MWSRTRIGMAIMRISIRWLCRERELESRGVVFWGRGVDAYRKIVMESTTTLYIRFPCSRPMGSQPSEY